MDEGSHGLLGEGKRRSLKCTILGLHEALSFYDFFPPSSFSVSCNMIERSVVEAAVLECSQSLDETMYVGVLSFEGKKLNLIQLIGLMLSPPVAISDRT